MSVAPYLLFIRPNFNPPCETGDLETRPAFCRLDPWLGNIRLLVVLQLLRKYKDVTLRPSINENISSSYSFTDIQIDLRWRH
ncbi:hypothetical protein K461DRAFT_283051 [Myriangium duriaei CBS 260.36]|uniref:Uncharacterized protein n=1 Tax=Myriangium duriaei CBS 260.36 TaxID=1168546 RepID=A0A9P4IPV7_9PEZI|nr:hypothetical protein K461DRAFT_283051 [Myriangium duriaei CBS 260.36]